MLSKHVRRLFENKTLDEIRSFIIDDNNWPVCDVDGSVQFDASNGPKNQTGKALAAAKRFFMMFDELELQELKDATIFLRHIREEFERMHIIPNQVNTVQTVRMNKNTEAIMRDILSSHDADERRHKMLRGLQEEDNGFLKALSEETSYAEDDLRAMIADGRAIKHDGIMLFAARRLQLRHTQNEKDTLKYVESAKLSYDAIIRRFKVSGPIVR